MKKIQKLSDLQFDEKNANKHTVRGFAVTEESLRTLGAGRSVLADKNGKLIAGNLTTEVALSLGADEDVIVVPTDGSKLVIVQRTDLDLDTDQKAKQLAIADNRAAQVSLDWDANYFADITDSGEAGDLSWMFRKDELDVLFGEGAAEKELLQELQEDAKDENASKDKYTLVLSFASAKEKQEAFTHLKELGYTINRGGL